jgi:hypothetical protein
LGGFRTPVSPCLAPPRARGRRPKPFTKGDVRPCFGPLSHGLIGTLRRREVEALGERLAAETGQPFNQAATGEYVAGACRQRFTLASGRFAMIDDGLGFQLVPWTLPSKGSSAPVSLASPATMAASTGALAATGGWGFDHRHCTLRDQISGGRRAMSDQKSMQAWAIRIPSSSGAMRRWLIGAAWY